jgi:membrane-associated phospholipid phosphatase
MDVKSIALRLLIHAFPVILGLSRVALGRHYLSDIIGGSLFV